MVSMVFPWNTMILHENYMGFPWKTMENPWVISVRVLPTGCQVGVHFLFLVKPLGFYM